MTRHTYLGWTIEAVGLLLPDGRWTSELCMTHPGRSPVPFGLGEECDTQASAEQAAVLRAKGWIDVFGPAPASADAGGAATPRSA